MIRRLDPSLLDLYDTLLLDLDGTLIHGSRPIPGAVDGIQEAREAGRTIVFATNNASRSPAQVVAHLASVGIAAAEDEIVTSPQIASALLAQQLDADSEVLVIGSESLAAQIRSVGLRPVAADSERVQAVIQGWDSSVGWTMLAEGAYAIAHGARWMATNIDATLPTERGMAPGNGSLVAALAHATGAEPAVAGKPEPGMFELAAAQRSAQRPLAIGDRLDTDIEAANRAGMDSLLVLTGVSSAWDALHAEPIQRPTWIMPDLSGLTAPAAVATAHGDRARCGSLGAQWTQEGDIVLRGAPEDPRSLRAALALVAGHCADRAWTGALRDNAGRELDADLTAS